MTGLTRKHFTLTLPYLESLVGRTYLVLIGVTLLAIALQSAISLSIWKYTTDDAFITFRYARHFAEGIGPTFNVDGTRVEGYTSPLWASLLAATYFGSHDLETNSKLLGLGFNLGALILLSLTIWFRMNGNRNYLFFTFGMFLVALSGPLAISAVEGLETPALTFFTILTALFLLSGGEIGSNYYQVIMVAVGTAGMYFSRPDSAVSIVLIGVLWMLKLLPIANSRLSVRIRQIGLCYGVVGTLALLHLGWRLMYYGYLLPTTFYAKSGGTLAHFSFGFKRLISFFYGKDANVLLIFLPIALCCCFGGGRKRRRELAIFNVLIILILGRIA